MRLTFKNASFLLLILTLFNTPCMAGDQSHFECVRSQPEPLLSISSPGVKTHLFKMNTPTEGEETVLFKTGDRLHIKNHGCEYYVNTFRYESNSINATESNIAYWFRKSAEILRLIAQSKPISGFSLDKAATTLENIARTDKTLKFDHEPYAVEGDGTDFLQTQVIIKSGGRQPGSSRGYVEIVLLKGPL